MLKLNQLLYSTVEDDTFLDKITPTELQEAELVGAKNLIRDHLEPAIRQATLSTLQLKKAVTPRFRTQGSWKYRTCVQPAWRPEQQMDLDFGVYLPVSVWEESGPPHKMARLYFELVEGVLQSLCDDEGWRLIDDKDTCIRVEIAPWAHIDVCLYAVPEEEFELILERALATNQLAKADSATALDAAAEIEEQAWEDLDHIVLATRQGNWESSDPEAVSKWFRDRILLYNQQLRRVCQYLKAWRDFHWKEGPAPTSVSIMIAIAQAFDCVYGRDDLALEHAARRLAKALLGEIREDGIDEGLDDFNKRLNDTQRRAASTKASTLADEIARARALPIGSEASALAILAAQFGPRVPARVDLVDGDSGADGVRSTIARTVPPPQVRPTKSG
jgi:hypothetical protein